MDDNGAQTPQTKKTVRIDNLSAETMEAAVIAAFQAFGEVVSATKRKGRKWAYVDFADGAGFDAAIAAKELDVEGATCSISEKDTSRPRVRRDGAANGSSNAGTGRRRKSASADASGASLYVKSVSSDVTKENILDAFSKFGKISRVEMRSRRDDSCFAFVTFETEEQMRAAIEATDPIEVGNAAVEVEARRVQTKARVHHVPTSENSIYVRDFLENTTEEQLREAFSGHGDIVSIIKRVKTYDGEDGGASVTRTWAFVEYSSPEVAAAAVESANGSAVTVNGSEVSVELRSSKPVLRSRVRRRGAPQV